MESIDMNRVHTDALYRYQYLCKFIGFGEEDQAIIKGAAPLLAPAVPVLVDAVYSKLFSFNVTKQYFVPRQSGYDGPTPDTFDSLNVDHPQIKFRKDMLSRYLVRLVTGEYNVDMVKYIDWVGKIHTSKAGKKSIDVDIVHMNALMGFVSDAILATISSFNLPKEQEIKAMRAFSKLLSIQNDFIVRHYVPSNGHSATEEEGCCKSSSSSSTCAPAVCCPVSPVSSSCCSSESAPAKKKCSWPPKCVMYMAGAAVLGAVAHAAFEYFGASKKKE